MIKETDVKTEAVRVNNVAAGYGQGNVVSGLSFSVQPGKTFGLIGLNGVGKTTLIKIMLGLLEASEGNVELFGRSPSDAESKASLAYLPEKFEPPAFLSGLEFVKFSLNLYKRPFDREDVLKAADRIGLDRKALSRRVNTYSKGMRQKTGLMGTWLTGCPLLILDEPMSGLDPRARAQVKDELLACKEKGMTVFLSSHILSDMDEICDHVAVIHDGRQVFTGTPTEMKEQAGQDYLERAFLKIIDQTTKTSVEAA